MGHPDLTPGGGLDPAAARAILASRPVLADLPDAANLVDVSGSADAFRVTIVWLAAEDLLPGRAYALRVDDQTVNATIAPLRYRLEPASGEHAAATKLGAGEIGVGDMELAQRIAPSGLAPAGEAPTFALHDRLSGAVVGVGLVQFGLRRSQNVRRQTVAVDKRARSAALGQKPAVVWLTGLPGAGKSTVANLVESELHGRGLHTYLLDGDNVRHGLNSDLGFTAADRVENVRRIGEVAALMADAGLIVIVSFISPFRAERSTARALVGPDEFFEVHVDVPLEVAERRDPKGLYEKARAGQLANFTGIDSPYEPPENPEVRLPTDEISAEEGAARVVAALEAAGRFEA
jgi:bifunctional enzyme CysN/CysC